jgi:hypothetical protein
MPAGRSLNMPAGRSLILSSDSSASPEEAAAIVASLERFMRATAPPPSANTSNHPDAWHAAAILEGVSRDPWAAGDDWLNATPG